MAGKFKCPWCRRGFLVRSVMLAHAYGCPVGKRERAAQARRRRKLW